MLAVTSIVPVELKAIPRFEFKTNVVVIANVPPPNVNCPATALPGAAPRLLSPAMLIVPALIVVGPV